MDTRETLDRERVALVYAGGDPPGRVPLDDLGEVALVIAADSGLAHARRAGRHVDVVIGDLDSVDPGHLREAEAAGTTVLRHPAAKDQTDLELALDHALGAGADRIVVIGGHGGRADHLLANALLLTSDRYAGAAVEARYGTTRVLVVRRRLVVPGTEGELLTLLAVGGPARGVTTDGLRYPLRDEQLDPGSSRGVSNELAGPVATIDVREGVLLAVLPGPEGAGPSPSPPPMRQQHQQQQQFRSEDDRHR